MAEKTRPGRTSAADSQERRRLIAELVVKVGAIPVDAIATQFGISAMTVYRDVAALEEAGVVRRHRGRVFAVASGLHEASASFRVEQMSDAKQAMATVLAPRIPSGSSLLVDDSSSAVWLLRALAGLPALTIVTNSLAVAREFGANANRAIDVTGGRYEPWADASMGPTTLTELQQLHADFCVLSASGVKGTSCYHPHIDAAAIKHQMVQSASVAVLMVDHTKFTRTALHAFADISDFDVVVVDADTPSETVADLRAVGPEVLVGSRP